MGMTNAQKRKQAKKKAREKRVKKLANIRRSQKEDKYELNVLVDGQWIPGVMRFNDVEKVDEYIKVTEARRRDGEEIAPGKVIDSETGLVIREISGSKRKGALPDVITDGPKADPHVTGRVEERPVEVVVEETPKSTLTGEPDSR